MLKTIRKTSLILSIMMLVFTFTTNTASALEEKVDHVEIKSGIKEVKSVQFHPREDYMLQPVIAEDTIGKTEELASMSQRFNGVAAINGTFFNAYDKDDLQPQGAIMIDRTMEHLGGGAVAMGILSNSEIIFDQNEYLIRGSINGSYDWPNNWYAWGINNINPSDGAIYLFTPSFKLSEIAIPNFTFIVTEKGMVTDIVKEKASVPKDGFIIGIGPADYNKSMIDRFMIGDHIDYRIDHPDSLKNALHMLSNDPKLITDGNIDIDYERDMVRDPKMTEASAQRSFIGKKADGTIVMGTVAQVTIPELAEVLLKMGLVEALNLDGGASSGLYFRGEYITKPSRQLSNSLVVIPMNKAPRIEMDGEEIFFPDAAPYIEKGSTLIPVRGVFEKMGAEIEWVPEHNRVIATLNETVIQITVNEKIADVNGKDIEMPVAAVNKGGRVYIPLRFVAEALGADVEWLGERNTILIETN